MPQPAVVLATPFSIPTLCAVSVLWRMSKNCSARSITRGRVDGFPASRPREMVERDYTGPVRISGSAGTGKTIVAFTGLRIWRAPTLMPEFCLRPSPMHWRMRCKPS